jgi:hypothetical protein
MQRTTKGILKLILNAECLSIGVDQEQERNAPHCEPKDNLVIGEEKIMSVLWIVEKDCIHHRFIVFLNNFLEHECRCQHMQLTVSGVTAAEISIWNFGSTQMESCWSAVLSLYGPSYIVWLKARWHLTLDRQHLSTGNSDIRTFAQLPMPRA